jgi:hypothetical protein
MIRSLYNLTTKINSHIDKLSNIRDFKLQDIKPLVNNYASNDWEEYKNKNPVKKLSFSNNYSRIPIIFDDLEEGKKDLYDMFLIKWEPYCHTSIHNHPDGDCIMKLLEGHIIEQRFQNSETCNEIKTLNTSDISFMSDSLGLHRIINDNNTHSYSLHIYSPPIYYNEFESELKDHNAHFFKTTPYLARTMMLDKKEYSPSHHKFKYRDFP